jgi:hypothetical protein
MKILKDSPRDPAQGAFQIVQLATWQTIEPEQTDTRNPAAVALCKLGASKGGKARAEALPKAKRVMIAKKAAQARWKKSSLNLE